MTETDASHTGTEAAPQEHFRGRRGHRTGAGVMGKRANEGQREKADTQGMYREKKRIYETRLRGSK